MTGGTTSVKYKSHRMTLTLCIWNIDIFLLIKCDELQLLRKSYTERVEPGTMPMHQEGTQRLEGFVASVMEVRDDTPSLAVRHWLWLCEI